MRESMEGPRLHRQRFESVAELRRMVPKHERVLNQHGCYEIGIKCYGARTWHGTDSMAQTREFIDKGWADGLARVRKAFEALTIPALPSVRRAKVRADFGDEVDMQRVWSGDLSRAWGTTRRQSDPRRKAKQTVTVLCRVGQNCNVSAEQLFWQGAAALALVDALRKSGRSVKLIGYSHSKNVSQDNRFDTLVELAVLEPGQQIDMEKVASVLCLAGFFRTEFFKAEYNLPAPPHSGLGRNDSEIPPCLKANSQDTIFLGGCYDKDSAQRQLNEIAKKF